MSEVPKDLILTYFLQFPTFLRQRISVRKLFCGRTKWGHILTWMKASSSSSNTSGVASRDPASEPGTDVDCDIPSSDPTAVCICTRTRFKPFCFWSSGQRVRTNEDDLNWHHVRPSLLRLGTLWHHLHDVYGILMVDNRQKGSTCPMTSHTS